MEKASRTRREEEGSRYKGGWNVESDSEVLPRAFVLCLKSNRKLLEGGLL